MNASALRPEFRAARGSPIRAMLALSREPGMISLAGGHPDPALLPNGEVAAALRAIAESLNGSALQYGATEGLDSLREAVADRLGKQGIAAGANDVLVTTGSQQAISLLAQVLCCPGDVVAVAAYNYPAAMQALKFAGARLLALDDDLSGLREAAARGAAPKAAYVVPNFANPTGHVMGLEARLALLEAAAGLGTVLLEDDPYGELWFGTAPPPESLFALNRRHGVGATVAYATSFSKSVAPALRLGALVAPEEIRRAVVIAKQCGDVHSGLLEQRVLDRLLRSAMMPAHLAAVRATYSGKAQALAEALRRHAAGLLEFRLPAGGMFIWARLAGNAARIAEPDGLEFGRRHRVLVLPASAFAATDAPERRLRLSFANPPATAFDEGVRRLVAGLEEACARNAAAVSAP